MSHKTLPMAIFKPFGYSSSRTVLQMVCFWTWLALGCGLHFYKWRKSANVNKLYPRVVNEAKVLESTDDLPVPEATAHLSTVDQQETGSNTSSTKKSGDVEETSDVENQSS